MSIEAAQIPPNPLTDLISALERARAAWETTHPWHRPHQGLALRAALQDLWSAQDAWRQSGVGAMPVSYTKE